MFFVYQLHQKNASKLSILIFHFLDCTHYTSFFQIPRCCMWQHCLSDTCDLQFYMFIQAGKKTWHPCSMSFFFLLYLYFVQADSIAHCPGSQSPLMWIGAYFMVLTSTNYLSQLSQRTLFDHRLLPGGMPEPLQNYYVCSSLRNLIEWVFEVSLYYAALLSRTEAENREY